MPVRRITRHFLPGLLAVTLSTGLAGCVVYPDESYPPPLPANWSPDMVWLPSPGVYVAQDYGYPFFFYGHDYYYAYRGRWYAGPGYRGPWHAIPGPPRPLYGFQPDHWHDYQSRAGGYTHANPNWQHFHPAH